MSYITLANFITTFILTGVIWTIQLVHYPSFQYISEDQFPNFMNFHMKKISYIVAPLMLSEMLVSCILLYFKVDIIAILNILIIVLIWLSTLFLSIPCHNKLKGGHNMQTIKKLVLTNWPRTILWSVKSCVCIIIHFK